MEKIIYDYHSDVILTAEEAKEMCIKGGNKGFNFGYYQGTAIYFYLVKEWTHKLKECPMEDEIKSD